MDVTPVEFVKDISSRTAFGTLDGVVLNKSLAYTLGVALSTNKSTIFRSWVFFNLAFLWMVLVIIGLRTTLRKER